MPGDDVRDGLSFEGRYGEYKRVVDGFLRARLPAFEAEGQARLGEAMRYSAADGGKRVRGVLALAVNDLLGGDVQPALPLAGAIELIHAYSLVHDDMPCMDDDDFRRGKPSCHRAFGEAIALLAGDALLNLAFEVLLEWLAEQGPGAGRAAAAAFIARAAGADGMAGGQAIDLCAKIADESALTHLHRLKTGRLICAAVLAPAICLGAGADDYAALRQYGDG
ncbi:MAG: polyprenyl synthetase family protein, partial [Clostridiales bacterium]|nr:polyprenyl synthetase family protein [Clostridiales bacterium]